MRNTIILVSLVDVLLLISLCHFFNCEVDMVAVVVATVILIISGVFNTGLFKKLK